MSGENTITRLSGIKPESFPKIIRFTIFIVFVFFILKSIRKISNFFNIDSNSAYTYFAWFSILLFFFVFLPIRK